MSSDEVCLKNNYENMIILIYSYIVYNEYLVLERNYFIFNRYSYSCLNSKIESIIFKLKYYQ